MTNHPTVSVIIPAKQAAADLPRALESIAAQTYPNVIEVIVAAADEQTAQVAEPHATVLKNQTGHTPAGLNLAIRASKGEVIVRCDARSELPPNYVALAVEVLLTNDADNVGGMQNPVGETPWESSIARAMRSPLGSGNARYRVGGEAGPVETVYLGVFRRDALERAGGFDEEFDRTQDYELNHRLIANGGTVWFDPRLVVDYRPRSSLRELAKQFFRYGLAKRQFSRTHPGSLRMRQWLPPVVVVLLIFCTFLSIWFPPAAIVPIVYVLVLVLAGLPSLRTSAALATMHFSWALGFLSARKSR